MDTQFTTPEEEKTVSCAVVNETPSFIHVVLYVLLAAAVGSLGVITLLTTVHDMSFSFNVVRVYGTHNSYFFGILSTLSLFPPVFFFAYLLFSFHKRITSRAFDIISLISSVSFILTIAFSTVLAFGEGFIGVAPAFLFGILCIISLLVLVTNSFKTSKVATIFFISSIVLLFSSIFFPETLNLYPKGQCYTIDNLDREATLLKQQKCLDDDIYNKVAQTKDVNVCSLIHDELRKKQCYETVGGTKKGIFLYEISECSGSNEKEKCYFMYAYTRKTLESYQQACPLIEGNPYYRSTCYLHYAEISKDVTLCDFVTLENTGYEPQYLKYSMYKDVCKYNVEHSIIDLKIP